MVGRFLGILGWVDGGCKRPWWCIWGCLFVFGFKRGGSTVFGPGQACIEAKVGKASAKDGPLSGALKGRVSLLGLFSSTEKVWEGRVLFL